MTPPPGFAPLDEPGEFLQISGPLQLLHQGDVVKLGFRVERRHTNAMGILHGGMMATFCDMLLPMSIQRKHAAAHRRFLPTISLQVDYLAPVLEGAWVEGEAQILRATHSMVFAQGVVQADGAPAARVSGIFKIGAIFKPRP